MGSGSSTSDARGQHETHKTGSGKQAIQTNRTQRERCGTGRWSANAPLVALYAALNKLFVDFAAVDLMDSRCAPEARAAQAVVAAA